MTKKRSQRAESEGLRTDEGEEHEEEQQPRIASEEIVDRGVENGDEGDEGGKDELGGKDTVDLAYEAPSELVLAVAKTRVQGLP